MTRKLLIGILLLLNLTPNSQAQIKNTEKIRTRWAENVTPENVWQKYPRPQLVRSEWVNMNGLWDYAIVKKKDPMPKAFEGKILVPFCAESSLSGVGREILPDQKLWYKMNFRISEAWKGKHVLLHFDAVDWETTAWINGREIGKHTGGSDPFSFDITKYLKKGQQELVISVWDPTDTGTQPRGKQVLNPKGIWYTAVTGIWQTVWLEPVEKTYVKSILPEADIDQNKVIIKNEIEGSNGKETLSVKVMRDKEIIAESKGRANSPLEISIPDPELWTPYHPVLYDLEIELSNGRKVLDKVTSYFAMRKISKGKDEFGYERLMLNNKILFQYGTLDQGWWPGGLLTPPSEEAMGYDIEVLKDMGFNMLRKHIKVEPSRYYYYADSIGILIWQDMVSGFQTTEKDVQHILSDAKEDWDIPKEAAEEFGNEWKSIMGHLKFFPSIVTWVPFNEGWGQHDTRRIVEWTQKYDPTRLVDGTSGWTDRGVGDMIDAHQYPGPGMEPAEQNPGRAVVLGEFGGLGLPLEGHQWNTGMRNWGYRTYHTKPELIKEYAELLHNMQPMVNRGLAAAIYTQTTDVEGEVNGLMTYDRKEIKIDPELMRILHAPLYKKANKSSVIFYDSEIKPQSLLITDNNPANTGMTQIDKSAFASKTGPVALKKGDDRWAIKSFNLDRDVENLHLRILASGDIKVFLNGKLVADKFINTKRHYDEINLREFEGAIKSGDNNLLVEIRNVSRDSPFDFGLYSYE